MQRIVPVRLVALVALIAVASGACGSNASRSTRRDPSTASTSPAAPGYTPEFVAAACLPDVARVPGVRCSRLVVPERRSDSGSQSVSDARVRLFVTILPSRARPEREPVVVLQGGPGDTPDPASFVDHPLRDGHEVIILDERGTGRSTPSLACPEISDESFAQLGKDPRAALSRDSLVSAARSCRTRLARAGIDLGAYNTRENAADVADLRRALHIESWDLVGNSYGTRLALTVVRDHPQGVRAVGISGVYPPNVNPYSDAARATADAFDALFAGHPGLRDRFDALVRRLEREPVRAAATTADGRHLSIRFDGDNLVIFLRQALYTTNLIPTLPAVIEKLAAGQGFDAVAQLVADLAPASTAADRFSFGVYYSTQCQEDVPGADRAELRTQSKRYPSLDAVTLLVQPDAEICKVWDVDAAPAATRAPVRSAIPVLMFTGALDPTTPPFWIDRAAATLTHGYGFVLPGYGHDVTTRPCPRDVRNQFFAHPERSPEAACLREPPA